MALKLSSGDYDRIRKEANKALEIKNPNPKKLKAGKRGSGVNYIPPLNANIKYSFLPKIDKSFTAKLRADDLPEYFSLRDKLGNNFTQVPNQMRCGSCWAFATAGVLSDNYAVRYGVNPNISPSYILSFFSDGSQVGAGCDGGNPGGVVNLLPQYPALTNNCQDYSWCATSGNCSGDATQHFDKDPNFNPNTLLPTPGCFINNVERTGYFLKDSKVFGTENTNEATTIQIAAKKWMMDKGSLIGCFPIFDNFMGGDFSKTENIYIESVNYEGSGFISGYPSSMTNHLKGFHAVGIVGWGKSKSKIRYLNEKGVEEENYVPYWIGRNSWTSNWGDDGYFKIAMYPVNSLMTFELIQDGMGGLIGVDVGDTQTISGLDKAMCAGGECPKVVANPNDYYIKDTTQITETPLGEEKKEEKGEEKEDAIVFSTMSNRKTYYIIGGIVLLGIVVYFLMRKRKNNNRY